MHLKSYVYGHIKLICKIECKCKNDFVLVIEK